LIVLSLGVCAGRLDAHDTATPLGVQQELNCCLTLVRIAATRRGAPPQIRRARPQTYTGSRASRIVLPRTSTELPG
jgi:hypothetical protein